MDLEVAHAVAPDAQKVVVNARPTVEGDGGYEKIGQMLEDADRQFPGAVWSFSIGWGCDKLITAADLAPVRSALATAHSHGTTAFNASGDLAGLECKGGEDWSSPPGASDVGLDSVASLPEMVDVGGTTLSTDANGVWQAEQAWFDVPLSQGTGGGVSSLFDRPQWQRAVIARQGPDAPADARCRRGRRPVHRRADRAQPTTARRRRHVAVRADLGRPGGGDESVPARQRRASRSAISTRCCIASPPVRRCPGSATSSSAATPSTPRAPGYDLVTGLGTPDIDNLVRNLLVLQKATR